VDVPKDMQGLVLRDVLAEDAATRPAALFGVFGGHVNVTDGRYVYMRASTTHDKGPLFEYTLMPTHMRSLFAPAELQAIELAGPFSFTKGCPVMKIPVLQPAHAQQKFQTMLFDLLTDPLQARLLNDSVVEERMIDHMLQLMAANDAPPEQYLRLGLTQPVPI
jgi:hypothetical protein